jgi:ABC-2 type transport system permease protein
VTRLVAAELLKLRTTRTFWWLSFVAVALPVQVVVITLATSDTTTQDDARSLLSNIGIAGLFMLILGVVGAAGEYRHGTVTSTFLVAPERRRVLVAKAIVHGIAGLGAGAVATIMILAISVPWLSSQGHAVTTLDLSAGDVAAIAAGSIIYAALGAMLGVAAGSLVPSQVAAVVIVLILVAVVDPVVAGLAHGYGRFSLQGLAMSMSGNSSSNAGYELFSPVVSGLIYLGYVAVVMTAAGVLLPRRDVG